MAQRNTKLTARTALAAGLLLLLTLPLWADLSRKEKDRREAEVRAAYEATADLVRGSGHEISINITDFRHAQASEFEIVSYRDLGFDPLPEKVPSLDLVSVVTHRLEHPRSHIHPSWVQEEGRPSFPSWEWSLWEHFTRLETHYRENGSSWSKPAGIAVFQVLVTLDGETASYSADARWQQEGSPASIDDRVLVRVPLELGNGYQLTPFESAGAIEAWPGISSEPDYLPPPAFHLDLESQTSREAAIKNSHQRLVEMLAECGHTASLEVSDFRHFESSEFSDVTYEDLALSLDPERYLEFNVSTFRLPELRHPRVHVKPQWAERSPNASPTDPTLLSLTMRAALDRRNADARQRVSDPNPITALTTYRLKVSFEGKAEVFRALTHWPANVRPAGYVEPFHNALANAGLALKKKEKLMPFDNFQSLEAWPDLAKEPDYIPPEARP